VLYAGLQMAGLPREAILGILSCLSADISHVRLKPASSIYLSVGVRVNALPRPPRDYRAAARESLEDERGATPATRVITTGTGLTRSTLRIGPALPRC
jgi:hypothetical protein